MASAHSQRIIQNQTIGKGKKFKLLLHALTEVLISAFNRFKFYLEGKPKPKNSISDLKHKTRYSNACLAGH